MPDNKRPKRVLIAVAGTVIGGIILAIILQQFSRPDLQLVSTPLYAEQNGYSMQGFMVHNDGPVSVGNCYAYLQGQYPDGTTTERWPANTPSFYVPANSDAMYPNGGRAEVRFRLKGVGYQSGGKTVLEIQCGGYYREWVIQDQLLPLIPE